MTTSVAYNEGKTTEDMPAAFVLQQNHPNPFNAATAVSYTLFRPDYVTLKICNLLGEEVITLVAGQQAAGTHRIGWDGKDAKGLPVPSGMYLYRLEAGSAVQTRQMVVVR